MSHNNSPIRLFAALVAGAIVGASAGVLFAPAKGSKTRKIISLEAKAITKELVKILGSEAKLKLVKLIGLITAANENKEEMHQETKRLKI